MRLDQAVELAKKLVIHNDLDYAFFRRKNGQWTYIKGKPSSTSYTPREVIELALKP